MPPKPGPKPTGAALSGAERQRRYMERLKANRVTDEVERLKAELSDTQAQAAHLKQENARLVVVNAELRGKVERLTAEITRLSDNQVSDRDEPTDNPVSDGVKKGEYPLEIKRLAVKMADAGARPAEVKRAILAPTKPGC